MTFRETSRLKKEREQLKGYPCANCKKVIKKKKKL